MIYDQSFINLLKENLPPVKTTGKSIVCRCPWCEYDRDKDHYHLYISTTAPVFHCFHAGCPSGKGGRVSRLLKKIKGFDDSDKYIDKTKLEEFKKKEIKLTRAEFKPKNIRVPELNEDRYKNKSLYMKQRLKFVNVDLKSIKGLVFDIEDFVKVNNITLSIEHLKLLPYLQNNFVGFLSEHMSLLICRNIDHSSPFKHFKLPVQMSKFLDYYRIKGNNPKSNQVVLSEGIYDILLEQPANFLKLKDSTNIYASSFSYSYQSLIQSIVFHEQIFRPDVIILSDRDVKLDEYKKIFHYTNHIVNTMNVYYNKTGKDFNVTPINPEKFIIGERDYVKNARKNN